MTCKDCIHSGICRVERQPAPLSDIYTYECDCIERYCADFKDRSRFVELKPAEWIEDEDMYGGPIFRCSNCEARFVLEEGTPEDNEYYYCPTCGAKIQEQALKERES